MRMSNGQFSFLTSFTSRSALFEEVPFVLKKVPFLKGASLAEFGHGD
jgi:hypothetical protein